VRRHAGPHRARPRSGAGWQETGISTAFAMVLNSTVMPTTGCRDQVRPVVDLRHTIGHSREPMGLDRVALSGSSFHQVNLLACPEDDPLAGLDIPRYRPHPESHVERIYAHGAPEPLFTELVLQRMTVGAERQGIA